MDQVDIPTLNQEFSSFCPIYCGKLQFVFVTTTPSTIIIYSIVNPMFTL